MTVSPHQRRYVRTAGALGALAVVAGAFGAHGLEDRLEPEHLDIWHTAAQYHIYHAIALLAFAGGALPGIATSAGLWACRLWLIGIAIFSGSLYLLAVSGISWLGAITPFGGLALIAGWVCVAIAAPK